MTEVMKNHQSTVYLVCGSGGVGKTTMSAALGMKYAIEGKKAIVLTIDPARRLASSLGIDKLAETPVNIKLPDAGTRGEMWAMMLDTKQTFDQLVERYTPSQEAVQSIINNQMYQHMSQMLAGTQEYMAMEKLHEIHQTNEYDVIVLDTPPMQNAVEFLAAPQRMINMLDNSMLQMLLKPTLFVSKSGFKLLEKGTKQIFKVLDRIAGLAFLQELSDMFVLLSDLMGGFRTRADTVRILMSDPSCRFISVCTTNENSIAETRQFKTYLDQLDYRLDKVIVNRVYANREMPESIPPKDRKELGDQVGDTDANLLVATYEQFVPLIQQDLARIKELGGFFGDRAMASIPLYLSDVHDLDGLSTIAHALNEAF